MVVVAPTSPCGSLPVALWTLQTNPDRFVDPVPLVCGAWARSGEAVSFVPAALDPVFCSSCPFGPAWLRLDSLLLISARYVLEDGGKRPSYCCSGDWADTSESRVLALLPLVVGRDILEIMWVHEYGDFGRGRSVLSSLPVGDGGRISCG